MRNAQPERLAWYLFDARCHELMSAFTDFRDALGAGAVLTAANEADLAAKTGLPVETLAETLATVRAMVRGEHEDRFGRDFSSTKELIPPYHAVRVTGALFHTQGGLAIDSQARVRRADGSCLENLYAGGGAARGISGAGASGYLAGNGLLTATTLGRIAGHAAARLSREGTGNGKGSCDQQP